MIKPDPKILDDLTRMAGGAMNLFSGMREQIMNDVRARIDDMADRMDLVPREDFNRLEAQVKDLQKRLDSMMGAKKPETNAKKTSAPKKTVAKKTKKKAIRKKP